MDINYYFGRLHLISPFATKKEKDELIIRCMKSPVKIASKEGNFWSIVDCEQLELNENEFCVGYLVKYKEELKKEVVNENNNTIGEEMLTKAIDKKFPFIFSLKDYIIAYNYITGYENSFKNQFCDLLQTTSIDVMTTFEVIEISDTSDFLNEIRRFDKLTKLEIHLMPSNPRYKEMWKGVDERLRKLKIKKLYEKYEGEDIVISEDKDINSSLYMAADGYGNGIATGKLNNEECTIQTNKKQFSKKSSKEFLRDATSQLYEWFEEIANRYNNGDDNNEK